MIKLKIKAIDDIMINEFIVVLLLVVALVVTAAVVVVATAPELESAVTIVNYVRWGVVQVITPLTLVVINPA